MNDKTNSRNSNDRPSGPDQEATSESGPSIHPGIPRRRPRQRTFQGEPKIIRCHNCLAEFTVFGHVDEKRPIYCHACREMRHPEGQTKRYEFRVSGMNASEVWKLTQEFLKEEQLNQNPIQISNSTIGLLNVGQIKHLDSINATVVKLENAGEVEGSAALAALTRAIAGSSEITNENRSHALELVEELGNQATLTREARLKPGVIRATIGALAAIIGSAGSLSEVWAHWGPTIERLFQL